MLMIMSLLLSAPEVWSLQAGNMSLARQGRTQLLENLRSHSAFTHKVSPGRNTNLVHINFEFLHYEIPLLEEMIQTVTSLGYISMSWVDSDLTWNTTDYEGIGKVSIARDEIWFPTLLVSNAADPDYVMIERSDIMYLTSDGVITYSTHAYLKTSCDIDVTYYPFDVQTCHIIFVPYIYDTNYILSASLLHRYDQIILTGEWIISNRSIDATPASDHGDRSLIRFTMIIRRRILYYILCVLLPMGLTGVVSSVVFLLPPDSGEKISFLVTVFVTETVFLNFIASAMPRNMSGIPRLPLFLAIINVQCVLAMVATIFVIRKYDVEKRNSATHIEDNNSQLDDKIFVSQVSMDEGTEPQAESTNLPSLKNRLRTYIVKKLAFTKARLSSVTQRNQQEKNRKQQTTRRNGLRASTWNTVFFWSFNAISVMSYLLLFLT